MLLYIALQKLDVGIIILTQQFQYQYLGTKIMKVLLSRVSWCNSGAQSQSPGLETSDTLSFLNQNLKNPCV